MTIVLAYSILDPLYIIYYHYFGDDLNNNLVFFSNLVSLIIIDFFACVFNEVFILYCCNLEHETHKEISKRASLQESSIQMSNIAQSVDEDYLIYFDQLNNSNSLTYKNQKLKK